MGDVNTNIRMADTELGRLRCKYHKRQAERKARVLTRQDSKGYSRNSNESLTLFSLCVSLRAWNKHAQNMEAGLLAVYVNRLFTDF